MNQAKIRELQILLKEIDGAKATLELNPNNTELIRPTLICLCDVMARMFVMLIRKEV